MSDELDRVLRGPGEDAYADGAIFWFLLKAQNPNETLRKVREVMSVFLREQSKGEVLEEAMKAKLPPWFLDRFALGRSQVEYERYLQWWRTLSAEKQDEVERDQQWSMEEWLDCMKPSERHWRWWDLHCHSSNELLLAVTATDWPFSWGALRWLLQASDVEEITPEWEGDWARLLGLL